MRDVIVPLARTQSVPIVVSNATGVTQTVRSTIGANPDSPDDGPAAASVPEFPYERVDPLRPSAQTVGRFRFGHRPSRSRPWASCSRPSGSAASPRQVADGRPRRQLPAGPTVGRTEREDENRFISIYGAARFGVDLLEQGWAPASCFLAMLNIFIGLFNLVPLLPLDGGHIAIATYERLQELRKRNGRRHFTDVTRLLPLTYAVVLLLVLIGVSSLYLDIVNPVNAALMADPGSTHQSSNQPPPERGSRAV